MERKFCSLIILIFLMACFSIPSFAQENPIPNEAIEAVPVEASPVQASPMNWRQKIQEKIGIRKEKAQERKEQIKTELTERARNRIRSIYDRVRNRLQERIERLEKIAERIKNRFLFFEEKGRDITEASAKVVEAEKAIAVARKNLGILDEKLKELLSSNEPRTVLKELKIAAHVVRKDLSTARQSLAKAVNALVRNNSVEE